MGIPDICGMVHHSAVIGEPPESREHWAGFGVPCAPLVHPSARLEAFVTVDGGVRSPTTIGAYAWLMKHVHIGHDAVIGAECELAPGTLIGGHAVLGYYVKCVIGVKVLPFRRIGDNAVIGAGAVVTHDVPPGETWVGNPARQLLDKDRNPLPHSQR